jgi:predicted PurR-regulated permease PerM
MPIEPDLRKKLAQTIKSTVNSVFLSTLAAASVQSFIIFVSFIVLSIPAAAFAAGTTFILAWIPILGSAPVWLTTTAYLYFDGSIGRATLMLIFGCIVGVSDNFVRPAILKGRENIHPLVSIISIFGGLAMFGIMGLFIGPVIATLMIALLQVWASIAKRSLL